MIRRNKIIYYKTLIFQLSTGNGKKTNKCRVVTYKLIAISIA